MARGEIQESPSFISVERGPLFFPTLLSVAEIVGQLKGGFTCLRLFTSNIIYPPVYHGTVISDLAVQHTPKSRKQRETLYSL